MSDWELDDKEWQDLMDKLGKSADELEKRVTLEMADALLVLARLEVPFAEGDLNRSGTTGNDEEGAYTAFNIIYAAYQHEGVRRDGTHKIGFHGNGRKGKYLEEPLLLNLNKWLDIGRKGMEEILK